MDSMSSKSLAPSVPGLTRDLVEVEDTQKKANEMEDNKVIEINWVKVMAEMRKLIEARIAANNPMEFRVDCSSANVEALMSAGVRVARVYASDQLRIVNVRRRRGSGLLFTLVIADMPADRKDALMKKGFSQFECSYEKLCSLNSDFARGLQVVMGGEKWEEMLKRVSAPTRPRKPRVVKEPATIEVRVEHDPHWGSW